ncbi:fumarylpyruvate hydrolase [Phyllobacterium sp. 1468]|uniref:fumarylacetoacetate hydrolase family protein n=1 Tax=Phyllobacterium sp. 1468 TaxID=2817759 RepID=UPI00285E3248|nr:fumarylacetoacetate hydrolase family protein [Phyllobacterium sp. 1468]MDR6632675.1 fumarylpyruvate hydrolase [Phyllobacterium sp. 1468]
MHQNEFVFEPLPQPALRVTGSDKLFPVHRIYCVGRNYADHAIEMGHDPNREPPFFFQKNPDCLLIDGRDFPYPSATKDVHFEMEMVVALGKGGSDIATENALDHVFGYAVGLDMTRRDLQGEAKKLGRPWEVGKAFEASAPCSAVVPATSIGHPAKGAVWLKVNGAERQRGDLDQLIWKVPETISYLSTLFKLQAGDLIYTGTPAGVGAILPGDEMIGGVDGIGEIRVRVV